jgi:cobalt-zinc-cadmium efflux system outer membrane protein
MMRVWQYAERDHAWWKLLRHVVITIVVMSACIRTEATHAQYGADQLPVALQLSLDEALALFLKHNFDLLISHYGIDSAKAQQITAQLFANPTLNLGTFNSFNTTTGPPRQSGEFNGTLTQLFELAGKRGYRIESAKFGLQSAEHNFEDTLRLLSFALKDTYVRAVTAVQHIRIAQENRDGFRRIVAVNGLRFQKGFIAEVDLIRLRVQNADFEATVIQAQLELESALNDLRFFLAVQPNTPLQLLTELDFRRITVDLPALQSVAETRPDIRLKRSTVAQRQVDLQLAKAFRYPDPTFGPGFSVQGPKGPDNPQQVFTNLSLPLPILNRNQGGIVQAEFALRTAEADLKKTILQVQNEVSFTSRILLQHRRRVEFYQAGVLQDAKSTLSIIETAYERGGATILDLLEAARSTAAIQLAYIDTLSAYQRTVFQLASVIGQELPRSTESTEEVPRQPLRLAVDEALDMFLKHNLDLLMAHYGIEAAKGQQLTARLFQNPTLNLGTFSSVNKSFGIANSTELWGTLTQVFELAGKRGYRIKSAESGTRAAESAFQDAIRLLSLAVKDAYFRIQGAHRHLTVAEENRDRFRRVLEVNTLRFKKGFISGVDLIRIRLQAIDFELTVIQAQQDLESARNDLRLLLALPPAIPLELSTPLDFRRVDPDLMLLQQLAIERRPDVSGKRLILSQSTADLGLANAYRYPDPTMGIGFTVQGAKGPDNPQQVTTTSALPLLVFNRNQGGIVQANVGVQTAEADLKKTILQVQNEVNLIYRTLLQNRRLVEIYQGGVLEDARSSFSIIESAYQRGGMTILDLLDAAQTASAIQLRYVDALTDYQRNLFQLESATGGDLPAEPSAPSPPGQARVTTELSLQDAIRVFLENNLDVLMAKYGIESAKGQEITARLFPNPILNLGTMSSFNQKTGLPPRSTELWGNVTQLFEVAGKRAYRMQSAGLGTQAAQAALDDTVRQLLLAVKRAYYDYQSAQQHLTVVQENRDRFHRILEVNNLRLKRGFIAEIDVIRLRLQTIDFETSVIQSLRDVESASNDLRLLLALPPETTFTLTTPLQFSRIDPDLSSLQQKALERRPDLRMKRLTVSQRESDLNLARAYRYPDPSFGPGFTFQGPAGPDNPQQFAMVFSVPLTLFNRNQGGIAQADVAVRTATLDAAKSQIQVGSDVAVGYRTLVQNRQLVDVYQKGVLNDARSSFSIMESAYERRGVTILDLLDAARTAAATQLNYVDALTAYQESISQLESAVHEDIQR